VADFELGVKKPHLGKREMAMRNQLKANSINISRAFLVFSLQLLPDSVVDPQINVPSPELLFLLHKKQVFEKTPHRKLVVQIEASLGHENLSTLILGTN